jgi:hypothetical protein
VEKRFIQSFGEETLRFYLEDLDADGRIILKWILKKWEGRHGRNLSGPGKGQAADCCECCNEPPGSTTCTVFLE